MLSQKPLPVLPFGWLRGWSGLSFCSMTLTSKSAFSACVSQPGGYRETRLGIRLRTVQSLSGEKTTTGGGAGSAGL